MCRRLTLFTLKAAMFLGVSSACVCAQTIDINNGKMLHQQHCTRCHQPEIYQRDNRLVKNLEHLRTQVRFCEVSNDLTWFDEEVEDVTEYLNVNYYLFGLK